MRHEIIPLFDVSHHSMTSKYHHGHIRNPTSASEVEIGQRIPLPASYGCASLKRGLTGRCSQPLHDVRR